MEQIKVPGVQKSGNRDYYPLDFRRPIYYGNKNKFEPKVILWSPTYHMTRGSV